MLLKTILHIYLRIIKILYFDDLDKSNFEVNISRGSLIVLILSIILISLFDVISLSRSSSTGLNILTSLITLIKKKTLISCISCWLTKLA